MSTIVPGQERIEPQKQQDLSKGLKRTLIGGSLMEAIGGVIAITLTIIGLSGVAPVIMGAIAVIVVGIGLLSEAGTLVAEYPKIMLQTQIKLWDKIKLGSGFSAEALTAITVIVLGSLVLLGVYPMVLLPIAALVFGVGLVLTSAAVSFINSMDLKISDGKGHEYESRSFKGPEGEVYEYELRNFKELTGLEGEETETVVAHTALDAAMGVQVVLGFMATVLGILALVGFAPLALTLVSILVASIAVLMVGAAISGRVLSMHVA
jgi:hypothetical protein